MHKLHQASDEPRASGVQAHPDLEPKNQHMAATWEDMNSPGRTETRETSTAFTLL